MYKFSFYNFFIPIKNRKKLLIYNSLYGSLLEIEINRGLFISNLNNDEILFLNENEINWLLENKILIDKNEDEFESINNRIKEIRNHYQNSSELGLIIAPTNLCNMSCLYCFEGEKTNITLSDSNVLDICKFIEKQILTSIPNPIKGVSIKWFGGEPLLQTQTIKLISEYVINLTTKHNIRFSSDIVTNGTLLTSEIWELFRECKISKVQVTIDGPAILHNIKRKLISGRESYQTILENIQRMPNDFHNLIIRINADKEIFENIFTFFSDLEKTGIWPQRANQVKLDWGKKFYDKAGSNNESLDLYYNNFEYFKSKESFEVARIEYYNDWAKKNKKGIKRLIVNLPSFAKSYCGVAENPRALVLDGSGNIHKCFSTLNYPDWEVCHISEYTLDKVNNNKLRNFERDKIEECKNCKVLPICQECCNYRMAAQNQPMMCSHYKYFINDRITRYYQNNFKHANSNN